MVISIQSPKDSELLRYPLAIIRGTSSASAIHLHDPQTLQPQKPVKVVNTQFTVVQKLSAGNNLLIFHEGEDCDNDHTCLHTINYKPFTSQNYIRLIYLLTKDSDGSFQTADADSACDIESGMKRLETAALMIQAATAEMMNSQGFSRRTFQISNEVIKYTLCNLTTEEAHKMSGYSLWQTILKEFRDIPKRENTIDLAVMSFTRMINGKICAHTALGGDHLALFGGGSLFTWPESVEEIQEYLSDERNFDDSKLFDDSAMRAKKMGRRACTSTTIGALLHELGHCLSLHHPRGAAKRDGGGIMARGFDNLNRLFLQCNGNEILPFWDRGSALRLKYHRFLQISEDEEVIAMRNVSIRRNIEINDDRDEGPEFFKRDSGEIVCKSTIGLGHIGYYVNDCNVSHEDFGEETPKQHIISGIGELRKRCEAKEGDKLIVSAIDIQGRIVDVADKHI